MYYCTDEQRFEFSLNNQHAKGNFQGKMKTTETEGVFVTSVTNSSEDSGYDNGFLSDSSISSSSLDCYQQICVFPSFIRVKKKLKGNQHKCILNTYDISGNCIETLSPRTFQYISNCVTVLNLSNNKIASLPETVCQLKNLEELNLSHNCFTSVPESWKVLHKLKVLNLSFNYLSETPQCLEYGLGHVTNIDLSHNNITFFSKPPLCLPFLETLNLSKNHFLSLPSWLFSEQCRSLIVLDMSLNFCFDDCTIFSQHSLLHLRTCILKNLLKLNISNTGSKCNINKCLSQFEKLQVLHMGNISKHESTFNFFWNFTVDFFFNPQSIIELHVPKAGVAGLPEDFVKLENLQVLDLSNNPLDWLPDSFGNMKSLQELILTNCNLAYLPENFNQLTSLKKLLLDSNKLSNVRSEVTGLLNLECLDLYDNCLEEFPLSPSHLQILPMIDVADNYVHLEMTLDYKVDEENLFSSYKRKQTCLRSTDPKYLSRQDRYKTWPSTCDSSESLNHSYLSEEEIYPELDNQDKTSDDDDVEDENWDDDSSCSSDLFDPNLVERYHLPPGQFKFGWTPPRKPRECVIPISVILSGFLYVPGEMHMKNKHRRKANIKQQLVVKGQFDDYNVLDADTVQEHVSLWDLLKQKYMFVRNPHGPVVRQCRFCSIYEDCWHPVRWIRF